MSSVVRRISSISGQVRTSTSRRCRWRQRGAGSDGSTGRRRGRRAGAVGSTVRLTRPPRVRGVRTLDLDAVLVVGLGEVDADELLARGRHVLADVVGADRQLAMAAVDEHRQPDRAGTAEVDQGVHRRADRAPGVEDVVDEHDRGRR